MELSDGPDAIVSPCFTVITEYCLRIGGNGHSRPPRHLKTKFTPLNRAVRSLSTHPTANLAPATTSLPTWRGEHLNSPLCLRSSFSLSLSFYLTSLFISRISDKGAQDTRLEQIILNKFAIACYVQI